METQQTIEARERVAWAFDEPDPAEVVAGMREDARRVLSATTSPPGYGIAPDPDEE